MYSLDHIPARSDLELGYDYLYMLCGETINLDSLSLVDEYIQHYHFGIKTNIPLKNGEQRIRCLVLAILKQFEKKIPEAALLEFIIQLIKK
ncbi:MAG: hypothetical protein OQJ96_13510 [Flavobacteriales bacterium]|nr:hypothetical protein [Flavobacteriales bacterium]MCW8912886.1 hypothetical protein [Flavobacteriales bacterium]MCW8937235.1 hypothetical protein [Flavobacteriales bacterium]MCW8940088.1 hypothetical protein [Flavobacteriales bacterium]MCW8967804.1 hypothetical protein [Flavobacteriales bacterium]